MKGTVVLWLCVMTLAYGRLEYLSPGSYQEQFTEMLQLKKQAGSAADKVLEVLNDLRQAAKDELDGVNEMHDHQEEYFNRHIGSLKQITFTKRTVWQTAIDNREFVVEQQAENDGFLDWVTDRFQQIEDLIQQLQDERCEASLLFVTRCMEHMESIDAIVLLREDLQIWVDAGQPTSMIEVTKLSSFQKLAQYTTNYHKNSLQGFLDLTGDKLIDSLEEEEEDSFIQQEEDQVPSQRMQAQTLIDKLMRRLDEYESALTFSIGELIQAEIRAGRDAVLFIQESEKEVHVLNLEFERRSALKVKLENDFTLAQVHELKSKKAFEDAQKSVGEAEAEYEAHKRWYMSEIDRLRGDMDVVDMIVQIFLDELQGIDDVIRSQAEGSFGMEVEDVRFQQGILGGRN